MKDRAVLHCDCNGFYASVELLFHPELQDKPVVVGGDAQSRHGIVLAKNEAAKKFGIKTAETLWQAKQKCPDLVVLPPHHNLYSHFSKILNGIYSRYTDLVEPFGIDESWLDVTHSYHLFADSPAQLADFIRQTVRLETGLTISVGVSFNKVFAKLGSDYKKPDATTVISKENYTQIVYPLKVESLLYVGKTTQVTLNNMGIYTIGDLAKQPKIMLENRFGKHGLELYNYANGLENSAVCAFDQHKEVKSIGNGNTFSRNLKGLIDIKPALMSLSEEVGYRLRCHGLYAFTVQLTIRDPKFYTFTRQCKVNGTNISMEIYQTALKLLCANWDLDNEIRALTVTVSDLSCQQQAVQVSLFEPQQPQVHKKSENLQTAIDKIREKFGNDALLNATVMASDVVKKPKKDTHKEDFFVE